MTKRIELTEHHLYSIIKGNECSSDLGIKYVIEQILSDQEIVNKIKEYSKDKHFGQCDGCYPLWNWLDDNYKETLDYSQLTKSTGSNP